MFRAAHISILNPMTTRRPAAAFRPFALRLPALAAALAAIAIAIATPAFAQETREDLLAAQQAEKAAALHPYEPDQLERGLVTVKTALFGTRSIYPFIGSTFAGGGFALGPGYRTRYADTGTLDAHAAWSVKNYKAADVALKLPAMVHGRISTEMRANWLDAPDVPFFGTGNDSRLDDRAGFSFGAKTVGVSAQIQAARFFAVGGGIDSIRIATGPAAEGTSIPSANPIYRRSRAFAAFDWRTASAYTRRGGLYRLEWSDYHETNAGPYSFRRVDAEVQQFVPVLRENWIIALRALASSTNTVPGQDVPYFLMPDLGGSHTLRGYSSWRFRDRSRLLLTGEYRWTAGRFVDMALFLDAGRVGPRLADLDLHDFRKTYGLGASFHTPTSTVTRIEIARTQEGTSLVFSFSPSF